MKAPTLEMSEAEAKLLYQDYAEQIKERGDKAEQYLKDLKQTYYHLSQGRKILDIFEVFKNCEKHENGEPKLGIARADLKKTFFHKQALGAGRFMSTKSNWSSDEKSHDIALPSSTFSVWSAKELPEEATEWQKTHPEIDRSIVQANVPVIPAHILPSGALDNYYILFEVPEWTEVPQPPVAADPYLLKRINANAFVVLAEWDITPAELAVMRG